MARTISRRVPAVQPADKDPVKFDCIISADLHIREDVPVCRTDDYLDAQFTKLDFINSLCEKNDCPLLVAGDVFDCWKPSPWLISKSLELLPRMIITVPGQHDLPQHNMMEFHKSGLNTLVQAGRAVVLSGGQERWLSLEQPWLISGYAYGEKAKLPYKDATRHILLWHHMTCLDEQPFPDANADKADALFRKYPKYDLIITGDNHQQLCFQGVPSNRAYCNPGSMMRMTADQADHEPAVYGWCADTNTVKRILLPCKQGVVSREHLEGAELKASRDVRMEAYIVRAKKQYESRLSFVENLKTYCKKNKVDTETEKLIWEAADNGNE